MKIRNIFSLALAASAVLFASCTKETATDSFDNIKLDKTYLSIPADGGSVKLTINATDSWVFVKDAKWPEVLTFAKGEDGKTYKATTDKWGNITNPEEQIASRTASWLTASVLEGAAGTTEVTFSAESIASGRELSLAIVCGENLQHLVVRQGTLEASSATCAEILAGPDGKTYRTKGVCTAISNTTYGNWYINDGTGEVYVYGTLDKKGAEKNFTSLGLEVGDVVEIEGPKTTYGSTVELVNVTVLDIQKALAKVVTESKEYPIEGTYNETAKAHVPDTVKVAYKGGDFGYSVPSGYQDWLSVVSVSNAKGKATKLEPNPADTAYVAIKVLENAGGDRSASIDFTSGSSKVSYSLTQKGSIIAATVDEFIAAPVGETQYRVTGVITKLDVSAQYHNAGITVASGNFASSVLLYRTKTAEGNIEDLGLQIGDVITVVGKRAEYNGPQMAAGGILESYERYAVKSIPDFLAGEDDAKTFYTVSGEITKVAGLSGKGEGEYNNANITIKDADGNELYLYRVTTYDGSDMTVLNPQVGAKVTVFGTKGSYKGAGQMAAGGKFISYTPAE